MNDPMKLKIVLICSGCLLLKIKKNLDRLLLFPFFFVSFLCNNNEEHNLCKKYEIFCKAFSFFFSNKKINDFDTLYTNTNLRRRHFVEDKVVTFSQTFT